MPFWLCKPFFYALIFRDELPVEMGSCMVFLAIRTKKWKLSMFFCHFWSVYCSFTAFLQRVFGHFSTPHLSIAFRTTNFVLASTCFEIAKTSFELVRECPVGFPFLHTGMGTQHLRNAVSHLPSGYLAPQECRFWGPKWVPSTSGM